MGAASIGTGASMGGLAMKTCPYCGSVVHDADIRCRKCDGVLASQTGTLYRAPQAAFLVGDERARDLRRKALAFVVIGLLMKVYWGGYGPWPLVDDPTLASLRTWLEPLFIFGGVAGYAAGWILRWF